MLSMTGKRYKRQQIFSAASQNPNKKKNETMHYNYKEYIYLGIHWNRFGILRVAGHTESWIRWINHIAMSRGHVISHLYKTSRLVRNASDWPKLWSFKTTFWTNRFSEIFRIFFFNKRALNCLVLKREFFFYLWVIHWRRGQNLVLFQPLPTFKWTFLNLNVEINRHFSGQLLT